MKVQNYGKWPGDSPSGHHPPACTCFACNEGKQARLKAEYEVRRAIGHERRVEESSHGQATSHYRTPTSIEGVPNSTPTRSPKNGIRWGALLVLVLVLGTTGVSVVYWGGSTSTVSSGPASIQIALAPTETPTPTAAPAFPPTPTAKPAPDGVPMPTASPVLASTFPPPTPRLTEDRLPIWPYPTRIVLKQQSPGIIQAPTPRDSHTVVYLKPTSIPAPEHSGTSVPPIKALEVSNTSPTATPRPTATPAPQPSVESLRDLALEVINEDREASGSPPVALGHNGAAQIHADRLLENCVTGHWGLDGTTPGMRYALAGGQQINGENVSGLNYCIQPQDNIVRIVNPAQPLRTALTALMSSPGHRATILKPQYRKVNLGITWNDYNMVVVQQFEGDYVRFEQAPHLEGNSLVLEGRTVNGATPKGDQNKFKMDIYFHPFSSLSPSQIAQTYCLDPGEYAATIMEPAPPGHFYNHMQAVVQEFPRCVSPYDADIALLPLSYEWAHKFHEEVKATAQWSSWAVIQWLVADEWDVKASTFRVAANINEALESNGAGVYRVLLWGSIDGSASLIADYPVFYQVEPPTTYR